MVVGGGAFDGCMPNLVRGSWYLLALCVSTWGTILFLLFTERKSGKRKGGRFQNGNEK